MSELVGHIESTLRTEQRLMKPVGQKRGVFRLQCLQIYDEVLRRWVDLLSSTQLHDWAQLYVFQNDSPSQLDLQAQLPATRPIRSVPNGNEAEALWQLFQDIDVNGNGYIERDELQRVFSVLGMFEFSEPQVDDFFVKADSNRDGVLSYAEFSKFSCSHPHVAEALFKAGKRYLEAVKLKDQERAYLQRKQEEVEAQYTYLSSRRDVMMMEANLAAQRGALVHADAEDALLERNRELASLKQAFLTQYGSDPASPAGSPARYGHASPPAEAPVLTHGYARSRKYPRPVSSPRYSSSASPKRGSRD
eukprot:TRINITY_DN38621_c0_g1_i1.p1 TRINITY_DN38621_c0_g1~~TRINITY_DN38621_c0_g1_i1.p1  ORF type:complete len:328 (+),score=149.68 TRINITY_DN38621_c0_g1_i1:71-985(+)